MTESNRPHLEDPIDRYVNNELSAAEARALAQKALDDPELFEDLTFSALAKAALSDPTLGKKLQQPPSTAKLIRFSRRVRVFVAGAAAAAAIVAFSIYSLRSTLPQQNPRSPAQAETVTAPLKPALASSATAGQPILLASDLQSEAAGRGAPVFRSDQPDSRAPRPAGAIVSIENGVAVVDLGSLDGVAKGGELQVFRGEQSTQAIGRVTVTTVFRERARGTIVGGQEIQINDRVLVADAAYLGALLEQVDALSARGDSEAARIMAEKAVALAESARLGPSESRKALERLAALEYRAGSLQAAERHYQAEVDSLQSAPPAPLHEQSVALNNLAVMRLLLGDYDRAEAPLRQAMSQLPATDSVYPRSVNNLGVLAELQGDRSKAKELYTEALRVFAGIAGGSEQERRLIETNLARLSSAR